MATALARPATTLREGVPGTRHEGADGRTQRLAPTATEASCAVAHVGLCQGQVEGGGATGVVRASGTVAAAAGSAESACARPYTCTFLIHLGGAGVQEGNTNGDCGLQDVFPTVQGGLKDLEQCAFDDGGGGNRDHVWKNTKARKMPACPHGQEVIRERRAQHGRPGIQPMRTGEPGILLQLAHITVAKGDSLLQKVDNLGRRKREGVSGQGVGPRVVFRRE